MRRNFAVSAVLGTILILMIVVATISSVLLVVNPYIERTKVVNEQKSILEQFTAAEASISHLIQEGVGAKRVVSVGVSENLGSINIDPVGDRFIAMYATEPGYNFTASGLGDGDNQFSLAFSQGTIKTCNVYKLADDPVVVLPVCEQASILDQQGRIHSFLKFDLTPIYEMEKDLQLYILSATLKFYVNSEDYLVRWDHGAEFYHVDDQSWDDQLSCVSLLNLPLSNPVNDTNFCRQPGYTFSSNLRDIVMMDYNSKKDFCSIDVVKLGYPSLKPINYLFNLMPIRSDKCYFSEPLLAINYLEMEKEASSVDNSENQSLIEQASTAVKNYKFSESLSIKHIQGDTYGFGLLNGDAVEIGEERHSPPQPYIRLSKWDDEVSLKVHIPYVQNADKSFIDDKLVYSGDKHDVFVYPAKPETYYEKFNGQYQPVTINSNGGVEFDVMIYEKPSSNVFSFPFESKNLDFYYQPPLNPDHPTWADTNGDGVADTFRPEIVVGSYAVYHSEKSGDFTAVGGKNYGTGKAFQIYRPKIFSADGKWSWCELNVDKEKNLLTVTVDQNFLENVKYPLRLDPTFGYGPTGTTSPYDASPGSSWVDFSNTILGLKANSGSATGQIQKVTAYIYYSGATQQCIAENALIITDNGSKKIQDIKSGDKVLSYNLSTKKIEYSTVTDNWSGGVKPCLKINDLIVTYDQVIYTTKGFKKASEITKDDILLKLKNNCVFEEKVSILEDVGLFSVYDIVTVPNHNFFANEILVHNPVAVYPKAESAVYKCSDGSKVGDNGGVLVSVPSTAAWTEFTYSSGGSIASSTYYWLTIYGTAGYAGGLDLHPYISFDTVTDYAYYGWSQDCSDCGFPLSSFNPTTFDYSKYDIYCTVSTSAPTAPTGFTATPTVGTTDTIALSWTKGSGDYTRIQYQTGSAPTTISMGTNAYNSTGTSYSKTGLTPGTHYYFSAWSWSTTNKLWSTTYVSADATTYSTPGAPGAPTYLTAIPKAGTTTKIDLGWTKGGGAYTRIQYQTGSNPTSIIQGTNAYNGTGNTNTTSGLTAGTHYYFSAWSWNSTTKLWSTTYATADTSTYGNPTLTAVIDSPPTQATITQLVTFNGHAASGNPPYTSYMWDFGDGSTAPGPSVSHRYTAQKLEPYKVTFTVTDSTSSALANCFIRVYPGESAPDDCQESVVNITYPGPASPIIVNAGGTPVNLEGAVCIHLIDEIGGVDTIVGKIWLFDMGLIKSTLPSSFGTYENIIENGGILSVSPGGTYFSEEPYMYEDTANGLLSFRIRLIRLGTGGSGASGGSSSYHMKITHNSSSVRETEENVYNLKLQIYNNENNMNSENANTWIKYFDEKKSFTKLITPSNTLIYVNPKNPSLTLTLTSSIIKAELTP